MVRRLVLVVAAVLSAAPASSCRRGPELPRRVVIVTLDTLRADHLGCYGYPRPTSPNLDRLAQSATLFEDVTCSMPTTGPSHWTIFTGLTPRQHGVTRNGVVPDRDPTSLLDLLVDQGYETRAVVSAGVLGSRYIQGLGVERVFFGDRPGPARGQCPADEVTATALRLVAARRSQPLALWLHYYDPHEPYTPPETLARRFARLGRDGTPMELGLEELRRLNRPSGAETPGPEEVEHVVDLYDAEVAFMDQEVGKVLDALGRDEWWDSTLVIVVGDHGQSLGDRGYFGHGLRLLEPVIKVPLIIRLPGQAEGRRVRSRVETRDIAPTVAELLHGSLDGRCGGRSLLPALLGHPLEDAAVRIVERRTFGSEPHKVGFAVHGGDWKITYYSDPELPGYRVGRAAGAGGLDGESVDASEADEFRRVAELLPPLEGGLGRGVVVPEDTREMLRALGYVD